MLVGTQEFIAQKTGALMSHDEWRRIVGPKIAGRTRVGTLSRGVLTIKVASSAWSNELSFLKSDLLGRLSRGGFEVSDLRFRVDAESFDKPVSRKTAWSKPRAVSTLPAELSERLAAIEDPNLRAAVAEAARWSLGGANEPAPSRRPKPPR